jgi:hypothetical protein
MINGTIFMHILTGENTEKGHWKVIKINLLYLIPMIIFDLTGVF